MIEKRRRPRGAPGTSQCSTLPKRRSSPQEWLADPRVFLGHRMKCKKRVWVCLILRDSYYGKKSKFRSCQMQNMHVLDGNRWRYAETQLCPGGTVPTVGSQQLTRACAGTEMRVSAYVLVPGPPGFEHKTPAFCRNSPTALIGTGAPKQQRHGLTWLMTTAHHFHPH